MNKRLLLFIIFIFIGVPLVSLAQAKPSRKEVKDSLLLIKDEDNDIQDTTETKSPPEKKNALQKLFYGDFGGSVIMNKVTGVYLKANGFTEALGGMEGLSIAEKKDVYALSIFGGLEVRNYNGTIAGRDDEGGTAYDNYHYWYAGIPVMVQIIIPAKATSKRKNICYYAQAGFSLGINVYSLDVNSSLGMSKRKKLNSEMSIFSFQPFASGGICFNGKNNACEIGPYLGYVVNNISKTKDVTSNIFSYGIRLTLIHF